MERRTVLAGVGGVIAGAGLLDLADGDLDAPYVVGGLAADTARSIYGPGEPVPEAIIEGSAIPNDYQDYIDPELDVDRQTIEEMDYKRDLEWKDPDRYLDDGVGDCEDYAIAVASLLEGDGIPAKVVIGSYGGGGHVVAEDAAGNIYSVNDATTQELESWEPAIEFSVRNEMQGYMETTPPPAEADGNWAAVR